MSSTAVYSGAYLNRFFEYAPHRLADLQRIVGFGHPIEVERAVDVHGELDGAHQELQSVRE